MSSRYVEKSEDLTTDALPSPPRDESENSRKNSSDDSDNRESKFEEINTNSARSRKTKIRGLSNKKRTNPAAMCANIINISNSKDVHVGDKVTYNVSRSEKNEKPDIIETNAIKILRKNPNLLTQEDLLFVATHIDERWRDVGRALQFSEGQMDQFYINNKNIGMKEVIYQLLLDWYRNEPTNITIGYLASMLWNQNQRDVVKRWSEREHSANI